MNETELQYIDNFHVKPISNFTLNCDKRDIFTPKFKNEVRMFSYHSYSTLYCNLIKAIIEEKMKCMPISKKYIKVILFTEDNII